MVPLKNSSKQVPHCLKITQNVLLSFFNPWFPHAFCHFLIGLEDYMSHFLGQTKKLSEFMVILCSRFQQQIFIVAKMVLEMIFVIKPLFYSSFVQVLHPAEIKGPTPRCQAWLIYILLQHPKHWFEWLCRFAREILDTLRGKLKTWIGKKP